MSIVYCVGDTTGSQKGAKDKTLRSAESFVSIQLEKVPFRDLMLNEFVEKKKSMAMALRNPEEADKVKRSFRLLSLAEKFHLEF